MITLRHIAAPLGFAAILAVSASAPARQAAPRTGADIGFTIAAIPDTQNYLDYTHETAERFPFDASALFLEQMRYIAANVESAGGDIAFVTALGDIWQHQTLAIDPGRAARGFKRVANPAVNSHLAPTPRTQTVEMPMARQGYQLIAG